MVVLSSCLVSFETSRAQATAFAEVRRAKADAILDNESFSIMSGRPTLYAASIAERVLDQLKSGRSLRAACRDQGMPARGTVLQWVSDDREGFAARYRTAREIGNAPTGRPTVYTADIADLVLDELSDGRSLAAVCGDPGMPAPGTVRLWVAENREGFAPRYQTARQLGCDSLADQMRDIADDSSGDWIMRRKPDGTTEYVADPDNIRRSRLRIKARYWLLTRMLRTIQP
jgi:hypothetical protein